MTDQPAPTLTRCGGCYDSFSGPWCDNCDQWPCICPSQPVPGGLRQWLYETANDDDMPIAVRAWLDEEGIDTILRLAATTAPAAERKERICTCDTWHATGCLAGPPPSFAASPKGQT